MSEGKATHILAGPCPACHENKLSYNHETGEAWCEGYRNYASLLYTGLMQQAAMHIDRMYCHWEGRIEGDRLMTVRYGSGLLYSISPEEKAYLRSFT